MLEMDVYAWYGRVESASADTASSDMRFILWPEGTGDIMISGETDEINTQLDTLRDAEGQDKDAHLWGTLTCDSSDKGQCHLSVDRVRAMDNTPPGEPEEVADLIGLVYSGPPEPSSGGDDYLALIGPFNIQYGLHGASEDVESQLAAIRDSGQAISLTGQLMVGVPDWGGTQILVSQIEIADIDPNRLKPLTSWPPAPEWPPVDTGWQAFTNDRYGYQINYPTGAEIEWTGITGYPTDELPQGMDPDQYMQQLEAQYGDNLCVTIYFSLGYIHILPDWENSINYSVCGRTGVGVGEMLDKTDILTIDGMSYTVNGYEWLGGGESLSLHNETMVVILNNGTRIEYGARPVEDASFEDYLMKTRDTLLLIVQSYQALP